MNLFEYMFVNCPEPKDQDIIHQQSSDSRERDEIITDLKAMSVLNQLKRIREIEDFILNQDRYGSEHELRLKFGKFVNLNGSKLDPNIFKAA